MAQLLEEQISMFNINEYAKDLELEEVVSDKGSAKKIPCIISDINNIQTMTITEVFSGYDTLYATASAVSIDALPQLLKFFRKSEIIFGDERGITSAVKDIMAYQYGIIQGIGKIAKKSIDSEFYQENFTLMEMIESRKVDLFALQSIQSHIKMYLLVDEKTDRYRSIIGSANISKNALENEQLEILSIYEGKKSYLTFLEMYHNLKINSGKINKKALEVKNIEEVDNLPFFQQIKDISPTNLALLEMPENKISKETIHYVMSKELMADFLREAPIEVKNLVEGEKNRGKTIYSYKKLLKIPQKIKLARQELKIKENSPPTFYYDGIGNCFLEESLIESEDIKEENIKKDIEMIEELFNGFNDFLGTDKQKKYQKEKYFMVMVYMFASPFWGIARYATYNRVTPKTAYPLFMLINGGKSTGKSTFVEFISKVMFPNIDFGSKDSSLFTKTKLDSLRTFMKGFPIHIEDLAKDQWNNHQEKIIKNDTRLPEYISPIIITSNRIEPTKIKSEISKRTICLSTLVENPKDKDFNQSPINLHKNNLTGAFYMEYLRRMSLRFPILLEEIDKNIKGNENQTDLFLLSSTIIYEIFQEFSSKLPDYIRPITKKNVLVDVLNDEEKAIFIQLYHSDPAIFNIDKKTNKMTVEFESVYIANDFRDKIPFDVKVPYDSGRVLSLNLDKAKEYYGIEFREKNSGWFENIINKVKREM